MNILDTFAKAWKELKKNCRSFPSKRIDKTCLRNQIYTTIH